MRDAVAKFPADDWVRLAAEVGVPVQRVRSPEEALRDPEFERDGSVIEVDGMRMVGHAYGFEKVAAPPIRGAAQRGRAHRRREGRGSTRGGRAVNRDRHGPVDRLAARRRRRARPRSCGRGTVRHAAARRPRRDRHRGQQHGLRRFLSADVLRDVLQPREAEHRDRPQASRRPRRAARASARRRRAAAQHALRRRGASRASTTSRSST